MESQQGEPNSGVGKIVDGKAAEPENLDWEVQGALEKVQKEMVPTIERNDWKVYTGEQVDRILNPGKYQKQSN